MNTQIILSALNAARECFERSREREYAASRAGDLNQAATHAQIADFWHCRVIHLERKLLVSGT